MYSGEPQISKSGFWHNSKRGMEIIKLLHLLKLIVVAMSLMKMSRPSRKHELCGIKDNFVKLQEPLNQQASDTKAIVRKLVCQRQIDDVGFFLLIDPEDAVTEQRHETTGLADAPAMSPWTPCAWRSRAPNPYGGGCCCSRSSERAVPSAGSGTGWRA